MSSGNSPDGTAAPDPAAGLRAVLALRRLAERVEAEQVALARYQGWSWQRIADVLGMTRQSVHTKVRRDAVMAGKLTGHRASKVRDQRYGPRYNFGATYYDARDEAIRRGDRVIGTEHLVLALLADPASPAAQALACDLASARAALDVLDSQALAAVGARPGITAGPVTVRTGGRLRLTPAAKAVITSIRGARKDREAGLGIVLNALLDLPRPDPAAELLTALGIDAHAARERFAQLGLRDQK